MAEGTQVGSVYLDLQVRDTVARQMQDLAAKAQAAARQCFADVGKTAGSAMDKGFRDTAKTVSTTVQQSAANAQKAMTGAVNGAFSKTAATLQAKLKMLQKTLNDNEVRLAQIVEDTARGFTGSPWAAQATESALQANRAYQTLQKQQEKLETQMAYLRDRLAIEVQAAAAKQAAAEQAAYAKAAQAAEEAAKRQQAAARQAHTTAAPPAATRTINTDNAVRADSIASDAEQSANQTRSIWQVALDAISAKIKSVLGSGLSSLWRSIQSGAVKAGSALLGLAKKLLPFQTGIRKTGTGMQSLAVRLRSIVSGALVFNVISAGLTRMVSAMGTALTSSSQMQSALANLKGAAATAAAPIIQILTPALAALANAAATVFSYISQLISFFTGKSVSAMATAAKGFSGVGAAAGGAAKKTNDAAKAAKKANGELAAWDELNVLNKQQDEKQPDLDAGGGGGGGLGGTDMNYGFQGKSPFLDSILDAIKAGDWYGVGRLIGEKLRDSLNAIPWPGIQDKARQWATNIADTINGFVETPGLWEAIGHTLAQGMNTALYFLDTLAQTIHWTSLGQGLGKGLNQMVAELDWAALGRVLTDGLRAALLTLYGFVQTFNFGNLGLGIASGINAAIGNIPWEQAGAGISGAVRGILNTFIIGVQNTDWALLAQSVAAMVASVDWVGIFSDLSQLAVSILQAAITLVTSVDWFAVGQTVIDCLLAVDWLGLLGNLVTFQLECLSGLTELMAGAFQSLAEACGDGFLGGILQCVSDILTGIQTQFIDPIINDVKELLGIHSPSTVFQEIGINVVLGLLNGLTQTWGRITAFFTSSLSAIQNAVSSAWNSVSTMTASIWNGIGEIIRGAVNGIISIINGMIQAVVNGINAVIDIINGFSFDVPEFAQEALGTSKIGFDIAKVTAPQIPLLANGGVITQPTLAMMGEYTGAGHNPEIAAPQSLLAETVSTSIAPLVAAMAELIEYLRDGGDQEIVIRFAASGGLEQLVRLLKPYIDKEDNRRGGKLITGGVY